MNDDRSLERERSGVGEESWWNENVGEEYCWRKS